MQFLAFLTPKALRQGENLKCCHYRKAAGLFIWRSRCIPLTFTYSGTFCGSVTPSSASWWRGARAWMGEEEEQGWEMEKGHCCLGSGGICQPRTRRCAWAWARGWRHCRPRSPGAPWARPSWQGPPALFYCSSQPREAFLARSPKPRSLLCCGSRFRSVPPQHAACRTFSSLCRRCSSCSVTGGGLCPTAPSVPARSSGFCWARQRTLSSRGSWGKWRREVRSCPVSFQTDGRNPCPAVPPPPSRGKSTRKTFGSFSWALWNRRSCRCRARWARWGSSHCQTCRQHPSCPRRRPWGTAPGGIPIPRSSAWCPAPASARSPCCWTAAGACPPCPGPGRCGRAGGSLGQLHPEPRRGSPSARPGARTLSCPKRPRWWPWAGGRARRCPEGWPRSCAAPSGGSATPGDTAWSWRPCTTRPSPRCHSGDRQGSCGGTAAAAGWPTGSWEQREIQNQGLGDTGVIWDISSGCRSPHCKASLRHQRAFRHRVGWEVVAFNWCQWRAVSSTLGTSKTSFLSSVWPPAFPSSLNLNPAEILIANLESIYHLPPSTRPGCSDAVANRLNPPHQTEVIPYHKNITHWENTLVCPHYVLKTINCIERSQCYLGKNPWNKF